MEETNKYKYNCVICKKTYMKKSSLDKHKILCDFKIKSQREHKIEEEELDDIPNHLQLVKIVQELTIKCNRLEEKIEQMQNWVDRKKKKINIIEWLNNNIQGIINYNEWINTNISADASDFEYLMENNLLQTITRVLQNNLQEEKNPIICFSEKHHPIFYIVIGENTWRKAEHEDLVLLFKKIQNKILRELTKWKKENESKFDDNIRLNEKFQKAVIKLMSMSFQPDPNFNKMRNILCDFVKKDLKNIIEYDIEL
jgi:hypothetical protein